MQQFLAIDLIYYKTEYTTGVESCSTTVRQQYGPEKDLVNFGTRSQLFH